MITLNKRYERSSCRMIMVEVQLHCALVPGEKRGKLSAPVELPAGADGAWVAMGG